jgi:hypothetical protein
MERNTFALETALRVLTAIVDFRTPETADVLELRRFLPGHDGDALDDLARSVIRLATDGVSNGLGHKAFRVSNNGTAYAREHGRVRNRPAGSDGNY